MIDPPVLETMIACAGAVWLVLAMRAGFSAPVPTARLIARLPYRHRREARAIVAIASEHDGRHAQGSLEAFTARETLRTYLPETIAAYLAVPPALRASRRVGRISPDDELGRQLQTLRYGLERLREADADMAASRMAENGAFLHERFGPPPPPPVRRPETVSIVIDAAMALSAYLRRV